MCNKNSRFNITQSQVTMPEQVKRPNPWNRKKKKKKKKEEEEKEEENAAAAAADDDDDDKQSNLSSTFSYS